jgi:subtilase family serine protease
MAWCQRLLLHVFVDAVWPCQAYDSGDSDWARSVAVNTKRNRPSDVRLVGQVFAGALLWLALAVQGQQTLQVLHGHVRPAVSGGQAALVGSLPRAQRMNLAIMLPLRNQEELNSLLGRLYDPTSPDYHHFLSVEEFTAQFGPTAEDYKAVADFAQANGFAVTDAPANRMLVPISGTVDQVESAFHVSMRVYRHPTEDRTFYSPDREPALALSVPVFHIAGMDNFSLPHPPLSQAAAGQATPATGSGPGGTFLGSDMRAAYYGGTALTGAGQAVCTVEFGGYNPSDVAEYFNLIGQADSVPVTNVLLDGQTLAPQQTQYGAEWANEGELDIEQLVGMAPGLSQIRMYIGNSDIDILSKIASDNICKQIGASFVEYDDATNDDPIFMEFATQGQSVFAASGDWGAYPASEPAYPAEDVYVTGVGGTVLATTGPGGAWVSETGWSEAGGGVNTDGISIPSWQYGVADTANQASPTLRNVPDVAMDANGDTYVILYGLAGGSGGTSASAQRWAAFMALINQQAVAAGKSPLGFINPALYTIAEGTSYASNFHDTTSGTNNCCTPGEGFNAVTGYDLVTGWGSPTGQSLINALAGAPATGFTLTNSKQTTGLSINLSSFGSTTIKVNDQGAFAGSVSLAATGLPSGVTAAFTPSSTTSTSTLTLTATSGATTGAAFVTVTGTSGALTSSITIPVTVYAPGFALSAPPVNTGTYVGFAGQTTITVQDQGGFSGSVALVASGVPSGVTAAFGSPNTTTTSNLSFTSTGSAVPGTYVVTVTGTSGALTASTSVYLVVEQPGFNLSDSPGSVTISAGSSGSSTIGVSPYSGFSGGVTLSVSGMPSGMTASFSSNPATTSSVVTVSTNTTVPGATYSLTVNGVSGSLTSNTGLSVTVNAPSVPTISNLKATAASATSEVITWTTDQPSTSQVYYGYGSTSGLYSALVTSHSITINNLTPNTTYTYNVVSVNATGGTATSPTSVFTTPAGTAPQVGYVAFWGVNNSGVTVSWSTDVPATGQLAYGTTPALGQLSPLQTALTASHGVVLTGLTSGTTYYFMAESTGANGVTGYSTLYSFTTTGTAPLGPPMISNVVATSVSNSSETITWTTDQASTSLVNYGTTAAYGSNSTVNTTLVTAHAVTLTGLTAGTTYDFDVVSANAGAMSATSPNSTFMTTSASSPPMITNVATTNVTSSSATVTWTTDQAATSVVNFGTTTGYGSSASVAGLTTAHSVTLTGLTAGTTYDFDVVSANAAAQSTTSVNSTFNTPASNATPPYVGYVAFWGVNNTGVTISWSTDVPATGQLAYGTTPALGQMSPLQTALTASHGVVLTTLNPGTTYYFVAQSTGANGATGYSTTYSFTTTGTQTIAAPVISNVVAASVSNTSETITWTTDQASSSQVNYGLTTMYTLSSTLNTALVTSHTVTLTGLTAGTMYDFDVMSANASAESSTSGNSTFTTTGTAPAPMISNVSSSGVTSGTATITWTTDQAATSVVNYGVTNGYGSTASVAGLTTAHSVVLTGLTANTTYDFDVVSANAANTSSTSGNATFKTLSNTAPPPVISYVAFWGISSSGVTISWSTNEPATTAVTYGTTTALSQLSPVQTALTDSHGVTLTGLNPGTTYYFEAQSADGSGNTGSSTMYSFTTLPGPPTISGVTTTPAANHTATINWTTSAPTISYVIYGLSTSYGYYSTETTSTTTPQCTLSYVPSGTIHYQLISTDANGNQTVSADATFVEP